MDNQIEKSVILNAPIARVWQAIANADQFGEWFRVKFTDQFALEVPIKGNITYPGYEHMVMQLVPRHIEEPTYFAYTWCPYPDGSPDGENRETLVEFRLVAQGDRTELTIVESGFDALPDDPRREESYRSNTEGWAIQAENIANYVES